MEYWCTDKKMQMQGKIWRSSHFAFLASKFAKTCSHPSPAKNNEQSGVQCLACSVYSTHIYWSLLSTFDSEGLSTASQFDILIPASAINGPFCQCQCWKETCLRPLGLLSTELLQLFEVISFSIIYGEPWYLYGSNTASRNCCWILKNLSLFTFKRLVSDTHG